MQSVPLKHARDARKLETDARKVETDASKPDTVIPWYCDNQD